jgi:uncharacterized protein (DUF697 family)
MRRSVAAALGVAGGMVAASAFMRRRGALREHVDVYYEDGSMISLPNTSPDAQQLNDAARDILRAAR